MENSKNKPTEDVLRAAVGRSLERHVGAGQIVAVGLSGGMDSVVLLDVLRQASAQRAFRLFAVHVDHGLSPNAPTWVDHCRQVCECWDVPLVVVQVKVDRRAADGLEAAARRARHAAFAEANADWIVLAHHRGDQAETVLFNLLRGAGVRGAAAMAEANGRLLRPLLDIGRVELLDYARRHSLRWIEDESNADSSMSRNYLRHEIMPRLRQRFPGGEANLTGAARRFREATVLLDELALADLGMHPAAFPVPLSALRELSESRARNVLRFLLQHSSFRIPSAERLAEALRQLLHAAADRHPRIDLGDCILARRQHLIVAIARTEADG